MKGEHIESSVLSIRLNYKVSPYYTVLPFEDALLKAFEGVASSWDEHEPLDKVDQKNPSKAPTENFYMPVLLGAIPLTYAFPAEVKDIQTSKLASERPEVYTATADNLASGDNPVRKPEGSVIFMVKARDLQNLSEADIQMENKEPEHQHAIKQLRDIFHVFLNKEEPVAELKISQGEISWSFLERSVEFLNRTNPVSQPVFTEKVERLEAENYQLYVNSEVSEQIKEVSDLANKLTYQEVFRVSMEISEETVKVDYGQSPANDERTKAESSVVSGSEPGEFSEDSFFMLSQTEEFFIREGINSTKVEKFAEFSLDNSGSQTLTQFHPNDVTENGKGKKGEKEGKKSDLPLSEGHANTVKFQDGKTQQVERAEKLQPQLSYEPKHISIRLEEGSVRFMLLGDRLRLSLNLNEDFYRQPTTSEVQRLVQSLQSLGLNLEVLKLNGSSLYSSDQRQGAKKESREKSHMFSISEPSENTAKSFSLYL